MVRIIQLGFQIITDLLVGLPRGWSGVKAFLKYIIYIKACQGPFHLRVKFGTL